MEIRTIEFRGKPELESLRREIGEWVYGDLIHRDGQVFIGLRKPFWYRIDDIDYVEVIPETVGQLWKNGNNPVYEHDIDSQEYVLNFGAFSSGYGWYWKKEGTTVQACHFPHGDIIGNIHGNQNPIN